MSRAARLSALVLTLFILPGFVFAGSAGVALQCHMKLLDERVIAQFLGSSPDNTKEALIEIAKQQDFTADRLAKVMALIDEATLQKDLGDWVAQKMQACMLSHHQQ
jgi:hypothetical protein